MQSGPDNLQAGPSRSLLVEISIPVPDPTPRPIWILSLQPPPRVWKVTENLALEVKEGRESFLAGRGALWMEYYHMHSPVMSRDHGIRLEDNVTDVEVFPDHM